jgi:hypothetical protein
MPLLTLEIIIDFEKEKEKENKDHHGPWQTISKQITKRF